MTLEQKKTLEDLLHRYSREEAFSGFFGKSELENIYWNRGWGIKEVLRELGYKVNIKETFSVGPFKFYTYSIGE